MLTATGPVRYKFASLKAWIILVTAVATGLLLAGPRLGAFGAARVRTAGTLPPAPQGPPLAFEENRGQAVSKVRFIARGAHYTQFITADEIVWRLNGVAQDYAVYMRFPGATSAFVRGETSLPGRTNYLKGTDATKWVTGAEQFSAVRLTGLYPGVSLKLHGSRARPEYDFIVAPGADASVIRLRFLGAQAVEVGSRGELIVRTPKGELIHHAPVAYQSGDAGRTVPVKARFVKVADDEVRFELGRIDTSRELIIDPAYEYSTHFGGSGQEALQGFAAPDPWQAVFVNGVGEVYAAGATNSAGFPVTPGVVQGTLREDLDFYIVKLNAAGDTLLSSTYLGGTGDELGVGSLTVNSSGEILLAGTTQSGDFPTTVVADDTVHDGNSATEGVALTINASGSALVYSTYEVRSAPQRFARLPELRVR